MVYWMQDVFGKELLKKYTPIVDSDYPEEDALETFDNEGHQEYQIPIGMLN